MFIIKNDHNTGLRFILDESGEFYIAVGFYGRVRKAAKIPAFFESLPVRYISGPAFYECHGLRELYIPETITYISKLFSLRCKRMNKIEVHPDNPVFSSSGNCLINKEEKKILLLCQNSIIPSDGSVEIISLGAFFNCTDVDKIFIPPNVMREEETDGFKRTLEREFFEN